MSAATSPKPLIVFVHGTFCTEWPDDSCVKPRLERMAEYDVEEFRWSGGNTHCARQKAGAELACFLRRNKAPRQVLICHSHGGNVAGYAMKALRADPDHEVLVDRIICLGTPHLIVEARNFNTAAVALGWGLGLLTSLVLVTAFIIGLTMLEFELTGWWIFASLAAGFGAGIVVGNQVHKRVGRYSPGAGFVEADLQPDFRDIDVISAIIAGDEVRIAVGGFSDILGLPFALWDWTRRLAFDALNLARAALAYSMVPAMALLLVLGLPSDTVVELFVEVLRLFFIIVLLLVPLYGLALGVLLIRAFVFSHQAARQEALFHLSSSISMNPFRPLIAGNERCYFEEFPSSHPRWLRKLRHSEIYQSPDVAERVQECLSGSVDLDSAPAPGDATDRYRAMKQHGQRWFDFLWNHENVVTRPITTRLGKVGLVAVCVLVGLLTAVTAAWINGPEIVVDSAATFGGSYGLVGFVTLFTIISTTIYMRTTFAPVGGQSPGLALRIGYCMNLALLTSSVLTFLAFQALPWLYFLVGSPFQLGSGGIATLGLLVGLLTSFIANTFLERDRASAAD